MTTLAIPWIGLGIGVSWMVAMGFRAKRHYRLRKAQEDTKARAAEAILNRLVEEQRLDAQRRLEDERQRPLFAGMR